MVKHIELPTNSKDGKYSFLLETEKQDRFRLSTRISNAQSSNLSARFQMTLSKIAQSEKIKAIERI